MADAADARRDGQSNELRSESHDGGPDDPTGRGLSDQPDVEWLQRRLAELRSRIIFTGLFLLVAAVAVYMVSPRLIDHMATRLPVADELFFLSPVEAFVTRLKLALAGGFAVSLPFTLYQLARFLSPIVPPSGRRATYALIPAATALFAGGGALAYQVMLPVALRFLLSFAGPDMIPMLSLAAYVRFVLWLVLPVGLIFQLPLLITFLARLGLMGARTLAKRRKYAVLGIFIVAAVLTPADVFSMLLMAVPLWLLFEVSLLIARVAERRR